MSELQQTDESTGVLPTRALRPSMQQFGATSIEVTFLGNNTQGRPTWMLWNPNDPYLIGVLSKGQLGYTFEQRTGSGVILHENISFARVQRAIGG